MRDSLNYPLTIAVLLSLGISCLAVGCSPVSGFNKLEEGTPQSTKAIGDLSTSSPEVTRNPSEEPSQPTTTALPSPTTTPTPVPVVTLRRPRAQDGTGNSYSPDQLTLIETGAFLDQEAQLEDWVINYWGKAINNPFRPSLTELVYRYLFDLQDPSSAIVALEVVDENSGQYFYLPVNPSTGEFMRIPPQAPDEPFVIPPPLNPLQLSGGDQGYVLANIGGNLTRVDSEGNVRQTINKKGKWKVTLQAVLDDWVSGVTVINDEDRFTRSTEPLRFGFELDILTPDGSGRYLGMLLGQMKIGNKLIVFIGFEDNGKSEEQYRGRFYTPMILGDYEQEPPIFYLIRPSHILDDTRRDEFELVSIPDMEDKLEVSEGERIMVSTLTSQPTFEPGNSELDKVRLELIDLMSPYYEINSAHREFLFKTLSASVKSLPEQYFPVSRIPEVDELDSVPYVAVLLVNAEDITN